MCKMFNMSLVKVSLLNIFQLCFCREMEMMKLNTHAFFFLSVNVYNIPFSGGGHVTVPGHVRHSPCRSSSAFWEHGLRLAMNHGFDSSSIHHSLS